MLVSIFTNGLCELFVARMARDTKSPSIVYVTKQFNE